MSVAKYGASDNRRKGKNAISGGKNKIESINLIIRESKEVSEALKRQR
jgi:hypothetical protein